MSKLERFERIEPPAGPLGPGATDGGAGGAANRAAEGPAGAAAEPAVGPKPDAAGPSETSPHGAPAADALARRSLRFSAIEPPEVPTSPGVDPFAPPPARELPVQLVYEETREQRDARARKRARARADLEAHVAAQPPAPQGTTSSTHEEDRLLASIAGLGHGRIAVAVLAATLMAMSSTLGGWTWLVGPAVVAVVAASYATQP